MSKKRTQKINRNTMFYSEDDFKFEEEIGLNYISQDMNQVILLFQIDRLRSKTLDIYGETENEEDIAYHEPIELNAVVTLEKSDLKAYDRNKGVARYKQIGNLKVGIYNKTLEDNKIDIKDGDYIGYQVTPDQLEYFVVANDGRVNFDNAHSMYGTRPL